MPADKRQLRGCARLPGLDGRGGGGAGLCGIGATVKTMQMDKGTGKMTKEKTVRGGQTLVGNLNSRNQIWREGKGSASKVDQVSDSGWVGILERSCSLR